MEERRLGKTDIYVSVVGMGCWAIVGGFNWGPQDESDSLAALQAAYDSGITLFDTAEGYGKGYSEQLIGRALGGVRDRIILATKVSPSHFTATDLRAACENSLRRLRTDYIDVYQLHWPNPSVPIEETWAALAALRDEGKIRAVAVSNFDVKGLRELAAIGFQPASDQVAYNLLFRAVEYALQPYCVSENISLLCYSPIMQGLLTGKFRCLDDVPPDRARTRHFSCRRPQTRHSDSGAETETQDAMDAFVRLANALGRKPLELALQWLLAQPAVTSVLVGGRNAQQVAENVAAATSRPPSDTQWMQQLSDVSQPLKKRLGPNIDMWQSESRAR